MIKFAKSDQGAHDNARRMSIYDPLKLRLQAASETSLVLPFEHIEGIIGQLLPKSAHVYDACGVTKILTGLKQGHLLKPSSFSV